MRNILSISVPSSLHKTLQKRVRERGFESVSQYIRQLVIEDENAISAETLLQSAKSARDEYHKGKTLRVKSLKDLL